MKISVLRWLLSGLIFFCAFASPQGYAVTKTFRLRLVEDLGTLDWNYGELSREIISQMMEGLFTTDRLGRPFPALADHYSWSDAKKNKISIFLRKDLQWSDGQELCAQHFVDSWQRLQDKNFASPYAHYASVIKKAEARGCEEIRVELSRSAPEFPALLSHHVFLPIRKDVLEAHPKIFMQGVGLPVTGPYKLEQWTREQKIVLGRNPYYADALDMPKGRIDRIEIFFIPEEQTAVSMFEQNKMDWMKDISPIARKVQWESSATLRYYPGIISYYLGLNAKASKLLEDENLRRALSAALDRAELSKILGKEVKGLERWLQAEVRSEDEGEGKNLATQKVDFAAAKAFLEKAVQEKRMDLRLRIYQKPAHRQLAEWLQEQWRKKLGVLIPIDMQEAKIYWKEISTNPAPIFLSGITPPYNHPRAFLQEFLSNSSANWTSWNSRSYDSFVENNKAAKAEELLLKDAFVIPLYSRGTASLIQSRWHNFLVNPLGIFYLKSVH